MTENKCGGVGLELILDAKNVMKTELLEKVENLSDFMDLVVEKLELNVVEKCKKQFDPIGATIVYILAESSLTIHTFPEKNKFALNLFCCNPNVKYTEVLSIVKTYFDILDSDIGMDLFIRCVN